MTLVHREIFGSQQGEDENEGQSTDRLLWVVEGTSDLDTALDYMEDVVPAVHRGLFFKSLAHEQIGPAMWQVEARYQSPEKADRDAELKERTRSLEVGEYRLSFSTSGGTYHVTMARATQGYGPEGKEIPDVKNLINDGEGTDIVVPTLRMEIEFKFAQATITLAYIKTLRDLTGSVNDAEFYGFAAGEVLFLGAEGMKPSTADLTLTFHFAVERNLEDETIGGVSGVAKGGHQFVWARTKPQNDESAKELVERPVFIFVSTVYPSADFSELQIGTGA